MCRVIMVNRADFNSYDKQYGILTLMNHLEKECGGHGNGYALVRRNKIIESRKGQKLTNEQIYTRITAMSWDYLVYHTRINSLGGMGDANCHPFVQDNDCMAMNGTEHGLRTLSGALGRTDTEIIFRNMTGMGSEQVTRALVELGSVFIGTSAGKPYVVKAGGTLHRWLKGGKTFHASTFPTNVESVEKISDGYIWENGKENLQFIKRPVTYSYGDPEYYARYSKLYGYDYEDWDHIGAKKDTATPVKTPAKAKTNTTPASSTAAQKAESSGTSRVVVLAGKTSQKPTTKQKKEKGDDIIQQAYELGYDKGYEEAYEEGYAEGANDAYLECDNSDIVYREGYLCGYQDGKEGLPMDIDTSNMETDPSSEYNVGFTDGKEAGYDEGYEAGRLVARRELGLTTPEMDLD